MIGDLEQIEASEYEYPNEVNEVPVKAYLLYHLVVASALIHTIHSVDENEDVEHNSRCNVAAMEAGNSEEVVEEVVRRLHSRIRVIRDNALHRSIMMVEEVTELVGRDVHISESAPQAMLHLRWISVPQCNTLAGKVRPLPCLAGKEADTANDCPQQPLGYIFLIAVVARMHGKHHGHRAHDKYKRHQAHKQQRQVGMAHKRERLEHGVGIGPNSAEKACGAVRDKESAESEGI